MRENMEKMKGVQKVMNMKKIKGLEMMVNNMKSMKGFPVESSVYGFVDEEEAKMRFKYQSLLQDFAELQKETVIKKKRLQKSKQKKLTLLAEVRFLRRKYNYLKKNPPLETSLEAPIPPQNPVIKRETSAKERNYGEKDHIGARPCTNLDLNQASFPREEAGELQAAWEPLKMEKKLKYSTSEVATPARNLSLSICRDVGTGSNRSGKRVSWQDQVALRV